MVELHTPINSFVEQGLLCPVIMTARAREMRVVKCFQILEFFYRLFYVEKVPDDRLGGGGVCTVTEASTRLTSDWKSLAGQSRGFDFSKLEIHNSNPQLLQPVIHHSIQHRTFSTSTTLHLCTVQRKSVDITFL
jgi:hypothetical protein